MNTHSKKIQENRKRSFENPVSRKLTNGESSFQFNDLRADAIAQRKLKEFVCNSAKAKQAAQLQAITDNYHTQQQPIQREISFNNGDKYVGAQNYTVFLMKKIIAAGKNWDNKLGKTLGGFLNSGNHGPYEDILALYADLVKANQKGNHANEIGKRREESVASAIGGNVADTGKYGQDESVYLDPNPSRTNHRHVKLDVKTDSIYGIVGGAAKAKNPEKFRAICYDLLEISKAHGKTARVF